MRYARISDGYRLATSALTTRRATPAANKCKPAPVCSVPSPRACAGSASPRADRRARATDRSCRSPRRHRRALVAPRRHAREGEAAPPSSRAERRRLLDIRDRVARDARGIATPHRVISPPGSARGRRRPARGAARPASTRDPAGRARRSRGATRRRASRSARGRSSCSARARRLAARAAACQRRRRAARAEAGRSRAPSASGTPSSRARASRNGRSKPCRLWFSMTSGSACRTCATSSAISCASATSIPVAVASITRVRPRIADRRQEDAFARGSRPVVSRSKHRRRTSSNARSRKYTRPVATRYCSSGGSDSTLSSASSRTCRTPWPSRPRDAARNTADVNTRRSCAAREEAQLARAREGSCTSMSARGSPRRPHVRATSRGGSHRPRARARASSDRAATRSRDHPARPRETMPGVASQPHSRSASRAVTSLYGVHTTASRWPPNVPGASSPRGDSLHTVACSTSPAV